jgi:HlyD family secretion protein
VRQGPARTSARWQGSGNVGAKRGQWTGIAVGAVLVAVVAVVSVRFVAARRAGVVDVSGYSMQAVTTRDIAQSVEATGTVEPIEIVEIKSKASGQIVRMPVATGSVVKTGQLLAQIDSVNVRNQYDEAAAALQAAQVSARVSASSLARSDELYAGKLIAAETHESAQLADANARSALVKARTAVEIARQALDDATVRAPSDGTVLEQSATRGQVIASATASASGGTTLLKMADLSRVQIRALVSESDIGGVRPGVDVSVTVDAYPKRTFQGRVLKIEPQATVSQSVTMFPVLVSIDNGSGLLLPGMNGEVTIGIAKRSQVVAVPLEAVRSLRELASSASALGLDPDAVAAQVAAQSGGGRAPGGAAGASAQVVSAASASAPASADGTDIVFVKTASGLVARVVRLGISDYDWSEVVSGLAAGEQVALIGVAEEQAARSGEQAQIKARMGGMPGMPGGTTAAGKSAAAGGK